jgi:hypothetical protein
MTSHTRNVDGYKLKQISRGVYEQTLDDGKRRWFVRYKTYWKYTSLFNAGETPKQESNKRFRTLTDVVIAAN